MVIIMGGLREKLRKIICWKPDMRLIAVLSAAALLLLLIPLLRIAFYAVPWYDDYNYGRYVQFSMTEGRSLLNALKGAVQCARTEWWAWQGTVSSTFFMSLMPAVWGEEYYVLGPIFLILLLSFAVCTLVKVLTIDLLKGDWFFCVILQSVTVALIIVLIHYALAGFFWYNSGVHYVGMHSFLLLLAAAWIKLSVGAGRISRLLLVCWSLVGAVLAGGANFVTSLQGLVLGGSIVALGLLLRNKRCLLLLPSLFLYGYVFYKNVSAPGNARRGLSYQGWGYDPFSAVVRSFWEAACNLWKFTGWMTLAALVLLAPVIWQAVKKMRFRFRYPGLLLLWSVCFYACGFTPSLYTLGHAGLARTLNVVKITLQILLIVNEVYWLGWLWNRRGHSGRTEGDETAGGRIPALFYLGMAGLMLVIFKMDSNPIGHYSSWGAYYYVHTGEAFNFHQEYLERVETVKSGGSVVTVKPYYYKPWLLSAGELSDNPEDETNRAMASWYGKEAIICLPQEGDSQSVGD